MRRSALKRLVVASSVATRSFVCLALAIVMLVGCSDPKRAGKYEVSGSVTWNGEPVETGFVTFHPEGGKSDEAGPLASGRYSFYAHAGKNRVSIQAEKVAGFNQAMNQPNVVQFIPPKYNTESELSAEVTADGDNTFDFALTGEDATQ